MRAGTGTTVAVTAVGGRAKQPESVVIVVREDVDETKGNGRADVGPTTPVSKLRIRAYEWFAKFGNHFPA